MNGCQFVMIGSIFVMNGNFKDLKKSCTTALVNACTPTCKGRNPCRNTLHVLLQKCTPRLHNTATACVVMYLLLDEPVERSGELYTG